MEPVLITILFGLVFAAIFLWVWWNNPKEVVKRRLKEMPRQNISDLKDATEGMIVGTLSYVGTPLRAPLTGRPCAYYEVLVEQNQGKNNWRQLIRHTEGTQFIIEDGTGRAIVHLSDSDTAIVEDGNMRSGLLDSPSPATVEFLRSHGEEPTNFLGLNKTLRYTEGILEAGESVAVYGLGTWEIDPNAGGVGEGYRDRPKRVRISNPASGKMLVSDDPDVTSS